MKTLLAHQWRDTGSHDDKAAFDAFHLEMRKLHQPHLPVQDDVVERAARLRWHLQKIEEWKAQFISTMTTALNLRAHASPEGVESVTRTLETFLRINALEKIDKHEAAVREQISKSDRELEALFDWMIQHKMKRGEIGYTISHRYDWESPQRYAEIAIPDS